MKAPLVVLGGGPAGVTAAVEAARLGVGVTLVEVEPRAPRATHRTHLPARVLSRRAREAREGAFEEADWRQLRAEARERAEVWQRRQDLRLEDAGVRRLAGRARFLSPTRLAVGEEALDFDAAIVATGGRARTLPGEAPDGRTVLRPDDLVRLPALPASLIVVGGEAAAAEYVDALSRLGVEVAWIMDELGLLPSFDRELAEAFGDLVMERGVKLIHRKRVTHLAREDEGGRPKVVLDGGHDYKADAVLLCVGAAPQVELLDPEAAGLRVHASGALWVDARGGTNVPHIYGAGECTGRSVDVAGAEAMGRIAARRAAGREARPFQASAFVRSLDTEPALAQVGLSPEASAGREVALLTVRHDESEAGVLDRLGEGDGKRRGFLRVVVDDADGRVLGGSAFGPGARTLMTHLALALRLGATEQQLAEAFAPIPSYADLLYRAFR